MVFGLTGMVDFFEIEVSPFFDDSITDSNVRLHGTIGILLLDEIDADHSRPLVRAGFI